MNYHHLTIIERESILEARSKGDSIRKIATYLKRYPSTICRELKRLNSTTSYSPSTAQQDYQNKRKKCYKPKLLDKDSQLCDEITNYIIDNHWSPQQIVSRFRKEARLIPSYNTIYRYITSNNLNQRFNSRGDTGVRRCLRYRGRRRHLRGERWHAEPKVDYLSIHERPKFIENQARIGDWEIDTVLGKTGEAVLVTAVDRRTRYTLIGKASKKDSLSVNATLIDMFEQIDPIFIQSITPDHGREFLALDEIKDRFGATIYWPDPYSPEQRGTNENTNGLIREYFPKKQSLKECTLEQLQTCMTQLNSRPHRVLNYQTPYEEFFDKVLHLV